MQWFKFDPTIVGTIVEDLDLCGQGAYFKLMRALWLTGPLSEADVKRKCGTAFGQVRELMCNAGEGLSFDWIEALRSDAQELSKTRAEVATLRYSKQVDANDMQLHAIVKQLPSMSKSSSFSSSQGKKERAREVEIWPTFLNFWDAYERKGNRKTAEAEWAKTTQAEREAIMDNVPKYNASKPDKQFRKDGERYLKHRVWEDAIITPTTSNNGQRTESDILAATLAIAGSGNRINDSNLGTHEHADGRRE